MLFVTAYLCSRYLFDQLGDGITLLLLSVVMFYATSYCVLFLSTLLFEGRLERASYIGIFNILITTFLNATCRLYRIIDIVVRLAIFE